MKVMSSIKKICKDCKIIIRKNIARIYCLNTKHKQRQG